MPIRNEISATGRASHKLPAADTPKVNLPARRRTIVVESVSRPLVRPSSAPIPAQPASPALKKGRRVAASKTGHEEDRIALMRAPRAETNIGKNPESRTYIRGVLHPHPWQLRFGAVFSLLLLINVPAAVIASLLLLAFHWFRCSSCGASVRLRK